MSGKQKEYTDMVKIDHEEMKRINVTNVNMFVTQPNMPFPVVVPGFPQYTNDHQLDYVSNFHN